jgi:class 3 adenylate cyclase
MQQDTDLAARRSGGEPRFRGGESSGETTRDGNDICGIAVVEATRLCAAALPGHDPVDLGWIHDQTRH